MVVKSLDADINAALSSLPKTESKETDAQGTADLVTSHLASKGIKAVARVDESGDVNVKRVLIG